jgi:hypothetical protein
MIICQPFEMQLVRTYASSSEGTLTSLRFGIHPKEFKEIAVFPQQFKCLIMCFLQKGAPFIFWAHLHVP